MTTQPEALRLADWLDGSSNGPMDARHQAADELRRLHALNADRELELTGLMGQVMQQQAVMRQALEYLEDLGRNRWGDRQALVAALREALEHCARCGKPLGGPDHIHTCTPKQSQQEPAAWQWLTTAHFRKHLPKDAEPGAWTPLYTAPPRREWVGLIRGVRVDGDMVVVSVKGGNENARLLCGELLREKSA